MKLVIKFVSLSIFRRGVCLTQEKDKIVPVYRTVPLNVH